jgi:hypothetical protein
MSAYGGPEINDSGLVLALDAGNTKSYPGGGTTWTDLSGNGNVGTLTNGMFSYSNGGSIVFDGTNSYATVSNNISPGTGDFAICVFVYKTDTVTNRYVWDFGSNGGTLSSGTSITAGFRYYNPTVGYILGPTHTVNTWYNLVVSRISGITYFYSNGSLVNSAADAGNIGSWGTTLNIGRYGGNLGYNHLGSISNLFIYKGRGLTAAEVLQNYTANRQRFDAPSETKAGAIIDLDAGKIASYSGAGTAWIDLSSYGNTGTLINGPTYNSSNGGSIVLNGSNGYVSIPHNSVMNLTENHTISVWFYQTAATAGWAALFGKGTGDGDEQYCLLIDASRTNVYYDIGGGGGPYIQPTTLSFSLNTWYHLVVTQSRSGTTSTLKLYVNGVDKSSSTLGQSITPNTNTNALTLGVARGTSFPFPGRIAKFSMYNRTLTTTEIGSIFDATRARFGI